MMSPALSRKPLVACVSAAFALATPAALANVLVTNCADSGDAADLRHIIAGAADHETVDVSACTGTISLLAGEIPIGVPNLTIQGPGQASLTISGASQTARLFNHSGSGTLKISKVTLQSGNFVDTTIGIAQGGCVYSAGSLLLDQVRANSCSVHMNRTGLVKGYARGGAAFGRTAVTVTRSVIDSNGVYAGNYLSSGAGVATVGGTVNVSYSTISGNHANGASRGGGVYAELGSASIKNSTISGNSARVGGGVYVEGDNSKTAIIVNSTISGNVTDQGSAGMRAAIGTLRIYNSTIAFNTVTSGAPASAAGIEISAPFSWSPTIDLESVLITNNTYGNYEWDLSTKPNGAPITLGGTHNLITRAPGELLPGDTSQDNCVRLQPLRDNGGLTLTHALLPYSPAIDQGNNVAIDPNTLDVYAHDQRGSTALNGKRDYPRVSTTLTDIGAYELDKNDVLFVSGFDDCW